MVLIILGFIKDVGMYREARPVWKLPLGSLKAQFFAVILQRRMNLQVLHNLLVSCQNMIPLKWSSGVLVTSRLASACLHVGFGAYTLGQSLSSFVVYKDPDNNHGCPCRSLEVVGETTHALCVGPF